MPDVFFPLRASFWEAGLRAPIIERWRALAATNDAVHADCGPHWSRKHHGA